MDRRDDGEAGEGAHGRAWAQLSQPRFGSTVRDGGAAPVLVYHCIKNTSGARATASCGVTENRGTCPGETGTAASLRELTRAAGAAFVGAQEVIEPCARMQLLLTSWRQ